MRSGEGGVKWTSLFCRVRPLVTDGFRLLGPSTSTSSIRPTRASCLAQRGTLDDDAQALEALADDRGVDEVALHARPPRCRREARR